jgi:hypothetical protein
MAALAGVDGALDGSINPDRGGFDGLKVGAAGNVVSLTGKGTPSDLTRSLAVSTVNVGLARSTGTMVGLAVKDTPSLLARSVPVSIVDVGLGLAGTLIGLAGAGVLFDLARSFI